MVVRFPVLGAKRRGAVPSSPVSVLRVMLALHEAQAEFNHLHLSPRYCCILCVILKRSNVRL